MPSLENGHLAVDLVLDNFSLELKPRRIAIGSTPSVSSAEAKKSGSARTRSRSAKLLELEPTSNLR